MPEIGVFVEVAGFGVARESITYFIISVKQDGFNEWAVYRDYNAFQTLDFQLHSVYSCIEPIPAIDFVNTTFMTSLQTSRELLNDWLKCVLALSEVFTTRFLYQFLCINANVPPKGMNILFPYTVPRLWIAENIEKDDQEFYRIVSNNSSVSKLDSIVQNDSLVCPSRSKSTFDEGDIIDTKLEVLYTHSGDSSLKITLSAFTIVKILGRGSFGKVFLSKYGSSPKPLAMKVLAKTNISTYMQLEHILSEREVLGKLHHPFIIELVMAFQTSSKLFLIMEYCAGGELFNRLSKEGRFSETVAKFYIGQCILALKYIHGFNFVYRDLKPENILLDENGNLKLTDFGLSKKDVHHSSLGARSMCGTPEYMAPEIIRGEEYGKAVDWWSVGAVYYELICGLPPFYSENRNQMFERVMHLDLSFPKFVLEASVDFILELLVLDPDERLGSSPADAADLQKHKLFKDVDWSALLNEQVQPPWKPDLDSAIDTSNFDQKFTGLSIGSLQEIAKMEQTFDESFAGFEFYDETAIKPPQVQSALLTPPEQKSRKLYEYAYHSGDSKYIRDNSGAPVTKQNFFASWISTAKTLITKGEVSISKQV